MQSSKQSPPFITHICLAAAATAADNIDDRWAVTQKDQAPQRGEIDGVAQTCTSIKQGEYYSLIRHPELNGTRGWYRARNGNLKSLCYIFVEEKKAGTFRLRCLLQVVLQINVLVMSLSFFFVRVCVSYRWIFFMAQ